MDNTSSLLRRAFFSTLTNRATSKSGWLLSLVLAAIVMAFASPAMANSPDADVDGSGGVDVVDVQLTVNIVLAVFTPTGFQGDANYDGLVDVVDIQTIVNTILSVPIPVTLSTRPLANAVTGSPYSANLFAFGGTPPYTFAAGGGLPAGLSISPSGVLSGTPTGSGTVSIPVLVTPATGPAATFNHTLTILGSGQFAPTITSSPVTSVTFGQTYSYNIQVSGSPTPTLQIFNRPSWLTLVGTLLSGTPTTAHLGTTGTITLVVSNGIAPNGGQSFTIAVNSGGPTPAFTSTAPTTAQQGLTYIYNIVATGTPPATVSASNLPAWLTLNNRTLSGVPQAAHVGTTGPITLTASNGNLPNATQVFSITVSAQGVAPSFTSAIPPTTATAFVTYAATVVVAGTPAPTVAVANLPRWMTWTPNASGGQLSGLPGAGDVGTTGALTLTATNGIGSPASQIFTIAVAGQTYPGFQPEVIAEFPNTVVGGTGSLASNGNVVIVLSEAVNQSVVSVGVNNAIFVGHGPLNGPYTNNNNSGHAFATGLSGLDGRVFVVRPGSTFSGAANVIVNLWPERVTGGTAGQGFFSLFGAPMIPFYEDRRFGSFSGDLSIGLVWTNSQSADTTPPTRTSSIPSAGSINIASNTTVSVTFNEVIDPTTVAANFVVTDGSGVVPGAVTVDTTTMRTVIFTASRTMNGVVNVAVAGIRDLTNGAGPGIGNAVLASQNFTFTVGSDNVAPIIQTITLDGIPGHLNGSVANGGESPGGGRLQMRQNNFTIDIMYTDDGGTGVSTSPSDLSITTNVAIGAIGAGQNIASLFPSTHLSVTRTKASLLVPTNVTLPVGVITLTIRVRDVIGNQSQPKTFTFGVIAATDPITPLETTPDVWTLYFKRDHETTAYNFPGNNVTSSANDLISPNTQDDFVEDMTGYGFMGGSGATFLVNSGGGLQVQQAARNWIINRIIYHCYRIYGLHVPYTDGNPNPGFAAIVNSANPVTSLDSPNIRFVNSETFPGGNVPRMAFGGIPGVSVLGRAQFNSNNTIRNEDNGTSTGSTNLGCFTLNDIYNAWNGTPPASASVMFTYYDEITPFAGGTVKTPVGGDSINDPFIFDPQQNPATFVGARATRYRRVIRAMDAFALQWAVVCSHEIGHSLGLIMDGAPGAGLYGGVAAFINTTGGHIDLSAYQFGVGQNVMRPAISFESTQSRFSAINTLAMSYLLGRELAD